MGDHCGLTTPRSVLVDFTRTGIYRSCSDQSGLRSSSSRSRAWPHSSWMMEPKLDDFIVNESLLCRPSSIDWMRTVMVYLMVLVHTTVSLMGIFTVEPDVYAIQSSTIRTLLQLSVPSFFYLSGSDRVFVRDTFTYFIAKNSVFVLLPAMIGFVLVVIPTAYIGRQHRPCADASIDNLLLFGKDVLHHQLACGGFQWLSYLPVYFVISLVNYPLLALLRQYKFSKDAFMYLPGSTSTFLWSGFVFVAAVQYALLFDIPIAFVAIACVPYVMMAIVLKLANILNRWPALSSPILLLCNVVPSILLAWFAKLAQGKNTTIVSGLFLNLFYTEGFMRNLIYSDRADSLMPLKLLGTILSLAVTLPTQAANMAHLPVYPLYSRDSIRCSVFVAGTWVMIYVANWGQSYFKQGVSDSFYRHLFQSMSVVYIFHFMYIEILQALFVPSSFMLALGLIYPTTLALCLATYAFFVKVGWLSQICCRAYLHEGEKHQNEPPPIRAAGGRQDPLELDKSISVSALSMVMTPCWFSNDADDWADLLTDAKVTTLRQQSESERMRRLVHCLNLSDAHWA